MINIRENVSASIFTAPPLILVQPEDMPTVRDGNWEGFVYDHKFDVPTQIAISTNMEHMVAMHDANLAQMVARLFVYKMDLGKITPSEIEIAEGVLRTIENATLAEFVANSLKVELPLSTDSPICANFRRALSGMHMKEVPARVSIFVDSGFNYWEEKAR